MTSVKTEKPLWKKLLLPVCGGALAGFAGSFAFLRLTGEGSAWQLDASREIAGLVGIVFLLMASAVLAGVLRPSAGARFLNVEDAGELREQRTQLIYSGVGTMAFGGVLLALALTGEGLPLGNDIGAGIALCLIVVGAVLSIFSRKHSDELQTALSKEAVGTSFSLLFLFGGGWAILAHADQLSAPAPLDWLTMFAVSLLIGAFWQAGRRGMLTRGPN